jgi:hypothetical protein
MKEIKSTVMNLETIASEKNLFPLLAETYFLLSQIALMELNIKESKELLGKALDLSEEKGLNKLAIKISNEYDSLLDKLDQWEDFTAKLPTIAEKMELTHIEKQLENVIKGRLSFDAEAEEELPVIFLLIDQYERLLFSQNFDESITQEVVGTLHHEINNIVREGLIEDRIFRTRIQEYNCIFVNEFGILICYLFIGKSYSSSKKLQTLIEEIEKSKKIRDLLETVSSSNLTIGFNDRIEISKILDEIFSLQNGTIST